MKAGTAFLVLSRGQITRATPEPSLLSSNFRAARAEVHWTLNVLFKVHQDHIHNASSDELDFEFGVFVCTNIEEPKRRKLLDLWGNPRVSIYARYTLSNFVAVCPTHLRYRECVVGGMCAISNCYQCAYRLTSDCDE
ncbi:hypothetical protein AVEN_268414-1 [Araneus ventricosus]|uniref:Uncharacterized protein n=1 Tax=Araneus ventricosus TaxID=182803 RepID=A0A4Y2DTB4_ARAVE|nr:hypothetical protein AVEN_268414-1 [Araneus ventricosus]